MVFRLDIPAEMCYCIVTKGKLKLKGQVIFMTMKTRRWLAVCGGTTLCAALTLLIAMTFTPENEQQLTARAPETSSVSALNTSNKEKPESTNNNEDTDNIVSESNVDPQTKLNPEGLIESGASEVKKGFPEPDTDQSDPPEPPKTEDKLMLTEPTYTPEQPKPKPPTATTKTSNTPRHGDTKDGMIYITGFGWVKDKGGGGRGEDASDMYENGNKIGYFG